MAPRDTRIGEPLGQSKKGQYRRAWKESHGTSLVVFAFVIVLAGVVSIWLSPPEPESPVSESFDSNVESSEDSVPSTLPPNALLVRVETSRPEGAGPIRIAIYKSEESFGDPDQAILKDSLAPDEGYVVWEIDLDILPERFAIAAFHDLDDNGELNRALFNAPVEPYGFSNDARNLVGPPSYTETLVEKPLETVLVEIRVY